MAIEIVDFPIKNCVFLNSDLLVYQRITVIYPIESHENTIKMSNQIPIYKEDNGNRLPVIYYDKMWYVSEAPLKDEDFRPFFMGIGGTLFGMTWGNCWDKWRETCDARGMKKDSTRIIGLDPFLVDGQ